MLKRSAFSIGVLVVVGLLLSACSTPTKEVTLVAEDIMWSMQTIEAKAGQPVKLTIRNDGALDHDFVAEDLGIDLLLSPGDIEVVEFTIEEAGTYHYLCSIPGHEDAGMVGDIIITE